MAEPSGLLQGKPWVVSLFASVCLRVVTQAEQGLSP
ncbi:uncharacterized protein METZ01_LOCUS84781 [marine metagenome]|uniref:Uncharacterized protein n=1 Tax=marine metagenome TaxID=408172 RepID=A0A381UX30_9ZZZZ